MSTVNRFYQGDVVLLPPEVAGYPHGQIIGPSEEEPGRLAVLTGAGKPMVVDLAHEQLRHFIRESEHLTCYCRMA